MNTRPLKTKVALVDDHVLLRRGLADYIRTLKEYDVVMEASDGLDFIRQLVVGSKPEIVLLDVQMPHLDGFETASWLTANHPEIKILALSVSARKHCLLRMICNGARGYVVKDIDPRELKAALDDILHKGFYYSDAVTGKLLHSLHTSEIRKAIHSSFSLNNRELNFLRLVCTELTYREIADRMCLSARTIDGYRDSLFAKLQVRTRVGLVMYAIRHWIVEA